MKSLYVVSIVNNQGRMVSYNIVATSMSAAITKAQTEAGVDTDPQTFQKLAGIDFEVA
jgi:hypothetical protein